LSNDLRASAFCRARQNRHRKPLPGNQTSPLAFNSHGLLTEATMGGGLLPIPIIILLWLFFGH
jgi:hypothetical protein